MTSGAHRRTSRTALVLIQILVFITYAFGPTSTLAEEPSIEPTPAESPAPEATPHPTTEPTSEPTIEPAPEPTVHPTTAPDPDPTAAPTATPDPTPEPTEATASGTRSYIVRFAPGTDAARQLEIVAAAGVTDESAIPQLAIRSVLLHEADYADELSALRANAEVLSVELDRTRAVEAAPSDTSYGDQWSLPQIGWDQLYGTVGIGGSSVVAVLDTGVDATHPDLDGVVQPGHSVLGGSALGDPNGHGTWMAGIVAAETDNGTGVAGTAYAGVSVLPVTVLGADGTGQDSDIIAGVVYAADAGADVILMSFSNPGYSAALQAAIDYAWASGAVLVAATGNDGSSVPTFPAGDRGVIGVASTDAADALAVGSNYGAVVFMAAPGDGIVTTSVGGSVATVSGTSAAAASVAGAAALLSANEPNLTNGVIVSRLARTADPAGDTAQTGNGRLNLARAMADASTDSVQPAGVAPVGNGGPLVGPYLAAAASDGDGTMTVSPTTAVAASTGNSFAFTFAAPGGNGNNFSNGAAVTVTVPSGWTAPQTTTPAGAGYVSVPTVTTGTCTTTRAISGTGPWTITLTMASGCSGSSKGFAFNYGSVTAPAAVGLATFTTKSKVSSGGTLTDLGTHPTVNVTAPANTAPTISNIADQTIDEDGTTGALAFTVGDAQTAPGSLTVSGASSNTTLVPIGNVVFGGSGASRTVTVTPVADTFGSATITVTVSDGSLSAQDTFLLTVNSVNDAPSFVKGANQTVNEDAGAQSVSGWATAISAGPANESSQVVDFIVSNDNNALFSTQPGIAANGTLTYTPAANAFGSATVSVQIHDNGGTANGGIDTSAAQDFTITVDSVNDAPSFVKGGDQTVAEDAGMQVIPNWATSISAGPANESGQIVTFDITGNTNAGLFSVLPAVSSMGTLSYTAAANVSGTATITLNARDDGGTANGGIDVSPSQTFIITVDAVNDAPTAVDDDYATDEDTLLSVSSPGVLGNDTDIDGGPLSTVLVDGPANGLLTLNADGGFDYTPNLNFNGTDSFTYRAFDGSANSNVAIVEITVNPVNDAPVCVADAGSTNEDTALVDGVICADVDGGSLSYAVIDGVASGSLSFAASGSFTYTPSADFNGTDGFTFRASDGLLNSNTVAYTITVNAVNDAPVADDDAYSTDEDTTLNVPAPGVLDGDTDIDGDSLTAALDSGPSNGALSLNADGSFSYTPDPDFNGTDSFTYVANDGDLNSNTATVTITVNPINDAPSVALSPSNDLAVNEGDQVTYAFTITDIDSSSFVFAIGSPDCGANGSVLGTPVITGFSGSFDCDFPDGDATSTVSVQVADDGGLLSNTDTQLISVGNVAPVVSAAIDQSADEGDPTSFSLGDFSDAGVDDDPWSVDVDWGDGSAVEGLADVSSQGSLGNASHTYDDNGTYTVTVTVTDKDGADHSDTFDVAVANVAPTATFNAPTNVDEGSNIALSLSDAFDPSGADTSAGFSYAFDCGDGAGYGAFGAASSVSCPTSQDGSRTVAGTIRDQDGGETEYTASVTIDNVAPAVTPPAVDAAENQGALEGSAQGFLLGSFTDPGADSPWTVTVDWGDGSSLEGFSRSSTGSIGTESHTYADNGTYTVTVTVADDDASGSDSFLISVGNVAPSTPTLVSPADGAITNDNTPTFDWTDSTDPAGVNDTITYSLQVDDNGCAFPSPEIDVSGLSASTYTPASAIPDGNAYCWRVWASDEDGGIGAYSSTRTLTVDATAPTVAITFPLAGAYSETSWNAGCVPLTGEFCGSASDATSGLSQTQVSIRRLSTGLYWNGSSFGSTTEVLFSVGNGGTWLQAFAYSNFPSTGQYTIRAQTTDNATNTSTTSVTFQLNRYTLDYQSPIDDSTPSTLVINTGKNGRVIPVKVRVYLEGVNQSSTQIAQGRLEINVNSTNCASGGVVDGVELYADAGASNGNTNDFRPTGDHWIYNLDTKALGLVTNQCYRLDVYLDGVRISTQQFAIFKPTK